MNIVPILELGILDDLLRLSAALACGGLIGWNRESEGREAGLRTHMMVSLGAAGFTLAALHMLETTSIDPSRIVSAIVGGVGFLGAGSIMKAGGRVHGLTTAAGLWVVASMGIACGLGFFPLALSIAGLAFVTLAVLGRIAALAAARGEES